MIIILLFTIIFTLTAGNIIPKPGFPEDDISRGRIISGYPAQVGEAPYIVSLSKEPTSKHFCAGSIIGNQWILTAAHCMVSEQIFVHAGLHDKTDRSVGQTIRVERIFKHSDYTSGIAPYDIALLRLSSPLQFNSRVQQISLPSDSTQQTGECILYGWGRDNRGISPEILHTVKTDLLAYNDCLRFSPWPWKIHATNICSASRNQHISACNGDSGGPLVQNGYNGLVLVGIVSWGHLPCGQDNYPSVYTHTGSFLDWINNNLRQY